MDSQFLLIRTKLTKFILPSFLKDVSRMTIDSRLAVWRSEGTYSSGAHFMLNCIKETILFIMLVSTYVQPTTCHHFHAPLPGCCVLWAGESRSELHTIDGCLPFLRKVGRWRLTPKLLAHLSITSPMSTCLPNGYQGLPASFLVENSWNGGRMVGWLRTWTLKPGWSVEIPGPV